MTTAPTIATILITIIIAQTIVITPTTTTTAQTIAETLIIIIMATPPQAELPRIIQEATTQAPEARANRARTNRQATPPIHRICLGTKRFPCG